jgi:hypothetical protein
MSITYNSLHVDEHYSDKLEANLYYAAVLVPGVTCDDTQSGGPAGAIYVHKLTSETVEPGRPGRDFEDEELEDDLLLIRLNNNYQRSRKIYGVQAASVSADLRDESLAAAQHEVQSGWQASGIACLVNESEVSEDKTMPTVATAKNQVIDVRTEIVKEGGTADVVLCAPSFYALILKAAGSEFLPVTNEAMAATGNVGTYLGMTWVEAGAMAQPEGKYYDYSDTARVVDFTDVDFVVYNHAALSAVTNFETARLVDSEGFVGSRAQVEMNAGFRVREPKLCRVHKHA